MSGGEPLMQPEFTSTIMREARRMGMNGTLDTSGVASKHAVDEVLSTTDHVLWCVKSAVADTYYKLTGQEQKESLRFGEALGAHPQIPWHMRYVVVPGYTDTSREVLALIKYAQEGPAAASLQAIELLPYHKLGLAKWKQLGIKYPLDDVTTPEYETIERITNEIRAAGVSVLI